jgi:hypothetical protein
MPAYPLHDDPWSVPQFLLWHLSTYYADNPDVLVGDDYAIQVGDSFVKLGEEVHEMGCSGSVCVSFSFNRDVEARFAVHEDLADAFGLTDLPFRWGRTRRAVTVFFRYGETEAQNAALQEEIIGFAQALIDTLLGRFD